MPDETTAGAPAGAPASAIAPGVPTRTKAEREAMLLSVDKLVKKMVSQSGVPAREREDAIQEAMLEVWTGTDLFDPTRGVKWSTYAGTIAIHSAGRYARRLQNAAGSEMQLDEQAWRRVVAPEALAEADRTGTVDELFKAVQRQLTAGLLDAVAAKPAKKVAALPATAIVEKIVFEGLTCEQLATQHGQEAKVVKTNLKNAIRKLRDKGLSQHAATDAQVNAVLAPDPAKKHAHKPRKHRPGGFHADPWKAGDGGATVGQEPLQLPAPEVVAVA